MNGLMKGLLTDAWAMRRWLFRTLRWWVLSALTAGTITGHYSHIIYGLSDLQCNIASGVVGVSVLWTKYRLLWRHLCERSERCLAEYRGDRISRAPGWKALTILTWFYSATTVERVFAIAVADMQHEHIEALAEGRPWKARWVLLRGYYSVWSAALAQTPVSLAKLLYRLWKAAA